ncbi:uncharacterized protein UV8b_08281 [Ustilaginoidea virens]|uniref:Secreted protein n=1 Tax=Ustilaginoidea virens TaxID=1159556 RepID=A0A8E5HYM1_USTVR|nr:uncharacterized protein UV8b_08281 [Ustilaginoidea virens]QUC24040.1 hypothetical protein UV8b_08281 [Ustilaginoidea virens]
MHYRVQLIVAMFAMGGLARPSGCQVQQGLDCDDFKTPEKPERPLMCNFRNQYNGYTCFPVNSCNQCAEMNPGRKVWCGVKAHDAWVCNTPPKGM